MFSENSIFFRISRDPQPTHAFAEQETVFRPAFDVLKQAIVARSFPAAAAAVTHRAKLVALKGFGRFTYESGSHEVQADTVFDLASVSKVVATTTMAMLLYQRGLLDLNAPVVGVVPEFARNEPRCRQVTFRMLLTHSSGLPAYEKLFLRGPSRDELLAMAFAVRLTAHPDAR